jgi:predicted acylesterase/phospholipase RssA
MAYSFRAENIVLRRHEGYRPSQFASLKKSLSSSTSDEAYQAKDRSTHLLFPGGGIFFYWQAGVVTYLREGSYDLSKCGFSGASAGALTATLAVTGVDVYEATDLALKLAADAGVWDRRGGLQGIWGPLIEEWLDELLPPSIEDVEDGRLSLLVTNIPSFTKTKVSQFADRQDLIQCNLASIHLVSDFQAV